MDWGNGQGNTVTWLEEKIQNRKAWELICGKWSWWLYNTWEILQHIDNIKRRHLIGVLDGSIIRSTPYVKKNRYKKRAFSLRLFKKINLLPQLPCQVSSFHDECYNHLVLWLTVKKISHKVSKQCDPRKWTNKKILDRNVFVRKHLYKDVRIHNNFRCTSFTDYL